MARSWSEMRKKLEQDYICEGLKGRIKYFLTTYRRSHDGAADRMALYFDGVKMFETNRFDAWDAESAAHDAVMAEQPLPDNYSDDELFSRWRAIDDRIPEYGDFYHANVYRAFDQYDNQSIEDSLASPNAIVRLFAYYDRRCGKRRLEKLRDQVKNEPEWLRDLVKLRYDAEETEL